MQSSVNALIDLKLEKHKNLREEAAFFWKEISVGTYLFDRKESEVSYTWITYQISKL
jgi:insulysin